MPQRGAPVSTHEAMQIAASAVTVAMDTEAPDFDYVWTSHVGPGFDALDGPSKRDVVAILAGLASGLILQQPTPYSYLQAVIHNARKALEVDP